MTEHIMVADKDSTRTITMRRPEKKNTLTFAYENMIADLAQPRARCRTAG